jgi:hypothetical protein
MVNRRTRIILLLSRIFSISSMPLLGLRVSVLGTLGSITTLTPWWVIQCGLQE